MLTAPNHANSKVESMPRLSAGGAVRLVHTDDPAAGRAGPFLTFTLKKGSHPAGFDAEQVGDRAGAVLRPVALVQLFDKAAGKFIAVGTIP